MGESIVLGLGNNIDYEIEWCSATIERMTAEHEITASEIRTDISITTCRDLLISILAFMENGTGGERFVTSLDVIDEFAKRFQRQVTLGGTSVRAAQVIRRLGKTSALHLVTINDDVRRMIPADCSFVCSNHSDTVYPHLISQFPKGACVRVGDIDITAKQADRVIYVHDPDNEEMNISPDLAALANDAQVFLVSGFNAMRNLGLLNERLSTLTEIIQSLPAEACVVYEDACFHDGEFKLQVRHALTPFLHIHSMNEDEWQEYLGRKVALLDPNSVVTALDDLHAMIPAPTLIVHTRYWALACGINAARYENALKAGVAMATTRLRFGDTFNESDYLATQRLPGLDESEAFIKNLKLLARDRVCCIPARKFSESTSTSVGLGDAFIGGFLATLPVQ